MNTLFLRSLGLLVALSLFGCGDDDSPSDASVPEDVSEDSSALDGSSRDGASHDEGIGADTGTEDAALPIGNDHTYSEDERASGGPERGFYAYVDVVSDRDFGWIRERGDRLLYSYLRIDDFRDSAIPETFFADASLGMDAVRAAGLKVILRFAYNFGPYPDSEPDASLERILEHIAQAGPFLEAHADIIATVQAGFIGAWGEWHTSTHGLARDPDARRQILEALVDVLPEGISTQIRYPLYKQEMYGILTGARAHDDSYIARVGHHNDCFLVDETDSGTYPEDDIESVRNYVAGETLYVPMGGETCGVHAPRSDCPTALREMEQLHFSYINHGFHEGVLNGWREQGCHDTIAETLGYRLVVESARFVDTVTTADPMTIELTIRNEGWAAPFNPRPLIVRLGDSETTLDPSVQWLLPGQSTTVRGTLLAPTTAGAQPLTLAAPDPHTRLADRLEYALPFMNVEYDSAAAHMNLGEVMVE